MQHDLKHSVQPDQSRSFQRKVDYSLLITLMRFVGLLYPIDTFAAIHFSRQRGCSHARSLAIDSFRIVFIAKLSSIAAAAAHYGSIHKLYASYFRRYSIESRYLKLFAVTNHRRYQGPTLRRSYTLTHTQNAFA